MVACVEILALQESQSSSSIHTVMPLSIVIRTICYVALLCEYTILICFFMIYVSNIKNKLISKSNKYNSTSMISFYAVQTEYWSDLFYTSSVLTNKQSAGWQERKTLDCITWYSIIVFMHVVMRCLFLIYKYLYYSSLVSWASPLCFVSVTSTMMTVRLIRVIV